MTEVRSGRPKLRSKSEIRRTLREGSRVTGKALAAHVLTSQEGTAAAFVAGRSVGGAVVRNRALRILREAWREIHHSVRPGVRVVFVARPLLREAKTADALEEMRSLLQRAGALRP